MLLRFSKVTYIEEYRSFDYDNAQFLCAIYHKDYAEYIKLLHYIKLKDEEERRDFGKIELCYDDNNGKKICESYSIADIILSIPKNSEYAESLEVYLYES